MFILVQRDFVFLHFQLPCISPSSHCSVLTLKPEFHPMYVRLDISISHRTPRCVSKKNYDIISLLAQDI